MRGDDFPAGNPIASMEVRIPCGEPTQGQGEGMSGGSFAPAPLHGRATVLEVLEYDCGASLPGGAGGRGRSGPLRDASVLGQVRGALRPAVRTGGPGRAADFLSRSGCDGG